MKPTNAPGGQGKSVSVQILMGERGINQPDTRDINPPARCKSRVQSIAVIRQTDPESPKAKHPHSDVQTRTSVTAYFLSEPSLPFTFALQYF